MESFLELSHYNGAISEYIYWKNRFQLASLMKKFLNGRIDREELSDSIFALRRAVGLRSSKLVSESSSAKFQDFNPNFRLKGSASFLYILCDYYDDYENDSQNQKFSEELKKFFLQLQEVLYLDKRLEEEDLDKYEK